MLLLVPLAVRDPSVAVREMAVEPLAVSNGETVAAVIVAEVVLLEDSLGKATVTVDVWEIVGVCRAERGVNEINNDSVVRPEKLFRLTTEVADRLCVDDNSIGALYEYFFVFDGVMENVADTVAV